MACKGWLACLGAIAVLSAPWAPARAQEAVFAPDTLHGLVEGSWAVADGERSWLNGGFGKTAFSGASEGRWKGDLALSQAVLEWRPQFSFALSAVVSGQYQAGVGPNFDMDEAYLKLKLPPVTAGRLSMRAGVFYPPISLEHGGVGWTTTDLLSASALNSWIGEEVKVGGAEATYDRRFGDHELSATAGVFGWNDTSGTLLSFRGWALDGIRTGVRTEFQLPPLWPFMQRKQDDGTYPMWEIDRQPGYYARLEWRPPMPVTADVFYYDNRGDRTSVRDKNWAWETRFADLGLTWRADDLTNVRAQVLSGETWMGYATPQVWVDVRFRAAYLMATRSFGQDSASARLDCFETLGRTYRAIDNEDESGWAATLGWRHALGPHADLMLEAQHVFSTRPARILVAEARAQGQDVLHSALRLHF